jgi:uncharacterized protein (DUF433 family)
VTAESCRPGCPTAADPYTVTLSWSPDQNFGRVSTYEKRVPLFAIVRAIRSGETLDEIADDYDLPVQHISVIAHLAAEVGEWT